jgi:transposase
MTTIASFYHINSEVLRKHYKHKISDFSQWPQRAHCKSFMIFPENIGEVLSIDEVSLSKGELYTFVTNKAAKSKNGTIVACVNGTKSEDVINVLRKIPLDKRKLVKEVTLDMASNMEYIVKMSFPEAKLTTDHFHVIRLAMEAMQHIRVKLRWAELDKENNEIAEARIKKLKYKPSVFSNGDTPKQLLARSRYIIAKKTNEWTDNQKERAQILFKEYPDLEKAYYHVLHLRGIYKNKEKSKAIEQLSEWLKQTEELAIKEFKTVSYTLKTKQETILNYFDNRNTNANAESFNAKIKLFRANLRGVKEIPFFMFRLTKLFA